MFLTIVLVLSGASGFFGIRGRMIKWLNPDAYDVKLEEPEEKAYFDKDRGVWVFPGDDPDELVKPIAPPPIIPAKKDDDDGGPGGLPPTPAGGGGNKPPEPLDPLAAMMAPPSRSVSALRRPGAAGSTPSRGYPGIPGLPGRSTASPMAAPPQFAVFQPKSAQSSKSEAKAE